MNTRIVLLVDMDYFFAQIEERENPQFKGKPVVVGADPKNGNGRGVVSTANYEARTYGVHSALPISRAFQLCPNAVFLPANMKLYAEVSERIMALIQNAASLVEQVSLDEAYIDVSFLKTYEKAFEFAKKLKEEIFEKEKLTATVGVGPNKMIAKIACSKAKPNGLLMVRPNEVQNFLDPLPIEDIPFIGPKTGMRIARLRPSLGNANGHMRISDLKKISQKELVDSLGKAGQAIYERARGIDESPVVQEETVKSIGKEYTFEKDTREPQELLSVFKELIKGVGDELKRQNLSFKTITVVARFTGFETRTKSKSMKNFSRDLELFKKEATKTLLRFIVENPKPFRLIGVRVSGFDFAK